MGFFDKIANAVNKANKTVKKIKTPKPPKQKKEKKVKGGYAAAPQTPAPAAANSYAPAPDYAVRREEEKKKLREELCNEVRDILKTEYSQYELQENVNLQSVYPAQEFGGPIDFALLYNGSVVGVVMIIDRGKKYTKQIHGVELACNATGARYANFYVGFNHPEYFPYSRELAVAYLKKRFG